MTVGSALSTLISGIDFQSRQGYAVAKLAMDQAKSQGDAMTDLLESAAKVGRQPVSDPTGRLGRSVDTYA